MVPFQFPISVVLAVIGNQDGQEWSFSLVQNQKAFGTTLRTVGPDDLVKQPRLGQ